MINESIPADNLGLQQPPLSEDFYLGWQRFPIKGGIELHWVAPADKTAFAKGYLQVMFESTKGEHHLSWPFYRLPVPAHKGLRFTIGLRETSAVGLVARLLMKVNDEVSQHTMPLPISEDWQGFELLLPAQESPALVELILQCQSQTSKQSTTAPAEIHLGPIDIAEGTTITLSTEGAISK